MSDPAEGQAPLDWPPECATMADHQILEELLEQFQDEEDVPVPVGVVWRLHHTLLAMMSAQRPLDV
jgi:hypothetical protein